jgi:hypothetical protein
MMQRSLTDAAQQLICNQQVIGSNPIAGSGRKHLIISLLLDGMSVKTRVLVFFTGHFSDTFDAGVAPQHTSRGIGG